MKHLSHKIISSIAVLSLVAACGNETSNSKSKGTEGSQTRAEEIVKVDGSHIEGHYQAKFITLNPHVNGTIPGSANFFRKEEKIYAYVRLFAGGVKAWHRQYVYTGGRCPTLNDDKNLDGFIDIVEAEAVLGKILIPLDSDISSQSSGARFFPLADLSGYYHYERITNFQRFHTDLQSEDKDPADDIVKLPPGEGLKITGKTVLIQGITETVELPETVATKGRFKAFQTFPIICGVFEKVETSPGQVYVQDEIPGPVGEVVEGQDRPAEDTLGESPEGETGGSTTGTNESDEGDGPVSDGEGRTREGGSTGGSDTTEGTGSSTSGSTTGGTSGGRTDSGSSDETTDNTNGGGSSSDDSTTTTTTTGGSSSSSSTGTSTGGFLDSSSGV